MRQILTSFVEAYGSLSKVLFYIFSLLAFINGGPLYLKIFLYKIMLEKINTFAFIVNLKNEYSTINESWKSDIEAKPVQRIVYILIFIGASFIILTFFFPLYKIMLLKITSGFLFLALILRVFSFSCFILFTKINHSVNKIFYLLLQFCILIFSVFVLMWFIFAYQLFDGVFDIFFLYFYIFLKKYVST